METPLLELIPDEQLTRRQATCRPFRHKVYLPIYKMTREPTFLDEFEWETYRDLVIWRENGTAILMCKKAHHENWGWKVSFTVHAGKYQLGGTIFHVSDHEYENCFDVQNESKSLETFTFFASLKQSKASSIRLEIDLNDFMPDDAVDYAAVLNPEQLACILDASPKQQLVLCAGDWSAEQSVILATRPYPLDVNLCSFTHVYDYFKFQDEGTAFVDALETRQSPFGSLCLDFQYFEEGWTPFSSENLQRLFNLDIPFEKLKLSRLSPEVALLAFSANTKALVYEVDLNFFEESELDSLNVLAPDLCIHVTFDVSSDDEDYNDNWDTRMVSFLNRLAAAHLTELKISVYCREEFVLEKVEAITEAFVAVIQGNPDLAYLSLSGCDWGFDWTRQLEHIFKAVEHHKGLRTLVVEKYPPADTDYLWLKRLLVHNHNIKVLDRSEKRCSDGSCIDTLYALNKIYCASTHLVKESASLRASLVGTTLVETASNDFQRSALLMSQHTDVVCEFLQDSHLESSVALVPVQEETESPTSFPDDDSLENMAKRMRTLD